MKRVLSSLLVLGLCIFALGCPSGEKEVVDGAGGETPGVTNAGGTNNAGTRKEFKQGIDSGRAEDGSDEDK